MFATTQKRAATKLTMQCLPHCDYKSSQLVDTRQQNFQITKNSYFVSQRQNMPDITNTAQTGKWHSKFKSTFPKICPNRP